MLLILPIFICQTPDRSRSAICFCSIIFFCMLKNTQHKLPLNYECHDEATTQSASHMHHNSFSESRKRARGAKNVRGHKTAPHHLFRCCGCSLAKTDRLSNNQIGLVSSGRPCRLMLLIALAAINRSCSIGLEGNLSLLPALCTCRIMHLSWAAAVAASAATTAASIFSLEHLIHLPFVSIQRIDPATINISTNLFEST